MTPFEHAAGWPVGRWAAAVISMETEVAGEDALFELASVSKLFAAMTAMVAFEEGSLELDAPAGPPGATVRHLLGHSSGVDFGSDRLIAGVGERRIYSNTGIEWYADHLARVTGMPYDEYLGLGVLEPLGLERTVLYGSPAHQMRSTISDLARFAEELMRPTLVSVETLDLFRTPSYPDLAGVLPGIGRFDPNPFGLAIEVKGAKKPHWTGGRTSPRTYGHFGGAGTFLWVDPDRQVAAVGLTDRSFDRWAMDAWPEFSDLVVQD